MNWAYVYGYANNPENSTVAGNVDVCLMPGTDKAESASVTGGGGFGSIIYLKISGVCI